jgi:hypothetical protein
MESETLSEGECIQRHINALRKSRDTYAAYGDVEKADKLLDEIGALEGQLQQISKPGRKPTERKDND